MGKTVELRDVPVSRLKPYAGNAKEHSPAQIEQIGRSIQELGFLSPCLIDRDYNVIAGHGRILAARQLGRESVPCVFIEGLTDDQRKAYILADNRLAEFSDWNMDRVTAEIQELTASSFDIGFLNFDIEIPDMSGVDFGATGGGGDGDGNGDPGGKKKPWTTRGVRCDMKPCVTARVKDEHRYISLYASSKEGPTLEDIKNGPKYEKQMAAELTGYIGGTLGGNLTAGGWALVTTGRRRHREGYHFATAVCRTAARELGIPFHEGMIVCGNADRLKPELTITARPEEKNLILFDDIITTGTTMTRTVDLLWEAGYTVMTVIGIRNQ